MASINHRQEQQMKQTQYQAAIFDLDGTLLYTLDDLSDSLNEALKREGLPLHTAEEYRLMVGNGLETLVVRALPEALRRPAYVRPVFTNFLEIYRGRQAVKTRPYDGTADMLKELLAKGVRRAVLSNKAHPNTQELVEHFFPGLIDPAFGLRPELPPKPDPAGALEIAKIWGIPTENILFLGDSDVDVKTALAAGMRPIGAAWGYRRAEDLKAAGAAEIIASPAEFVELFQ